MDTYFLATIHKHLLYIVPDTFPLHYDRTIGLPFLEKEKAIFDINKKKVISTIEKGSQTNYSAERSKLLKENTRLSHTDPKGRDEL